MKITEIKSSVPTAHDFLTIYKGEIPAIGDIADGFMNTYDIATDILCYADVSIFAYSDGLNFPLDYTASTDSTTKKMTFRVSVPHGFSCKYLITGFTRLASSYTNILNKEVSDVNSADIPLSGSRLMYREAFTGIWLMGSLTHPTTWVAVEDTTEASAITATTTGTGIYRLTATGSAPFRAGVLPSMTLHGTVGQATAEPWHFAAVRVSSTILEIHAYEDGIPANLPNSLFINYKY